VVNFKHMTNSVDITIKSLLTCFLRLGSLPWEDSTGEEHSNWQSYEVTAGHLSMEYYIHLSKTLKLKDRWSYNPGQIPIYIKAILYLLSM